jgi:hypothetical protein
MTTLEERIQTVRNLLEQRDAIDEQLETLLSGETHGPLGDRRFKNHGKDVDKFERKRGITLPKEKQYVKPARTCGQCGETGHRRDNCPVETPTTNQQNGLHKLSVNKYQAVMAEKDQGRSVFGTAALLHLPESEVRKAYESTSYIAYKDSD